MRRLFATVFFCLLSATSFGEAKLYSIEVREAPIGDIVRMLAKMEGKNVVVATSLKGKVTAGFAMIELEKAMEAMLEANDLGLIEKGGV